MADDVSIRLSADISELQKGLDQARNTVQNTSTALRGGADQINSSFSSLSKNFANEAIAYRDGTSVYGRAQGQVKSLTEQYATSRHETERRTAEEIYGEYSRSFERIGASFSSAITGMISGHERLRSATKSVLSDIVRNFIQARVKLASDWAARVATEVSIFASGEVSKTAAATAGATARATAETATSSSINATEASAILKSISASAGQTFAGIFGFLAPALGPAAAGPAAAGEAAVLSVGAGLASFAVGAWSLPGDMIAQLHAGEMVVPASPAAAFRSIMDGGASATTAVHVNHSTNFSVNAIDTQSVRNFFSNHGKTIMRTINENVRTAAHIGLSRLDSAG